MSPNPVRLQYLFRRYLNDNATPDEVKEFWELLAALEEDDPVKKDLWQLWNDSGHEKYAHKDWGNLLAKIHIQADEWEKKQPPGKVKRLMAWRIAAAVFIIGGLSIGAYLLFFHLPFKDIARIERTKASSLKNDIKPGRNKAVLTLSNGRVIFLDSANKGELAAQGNVSVTKLNGGTLVYHQQKTDSKPVVQYNTLTTPLGGKYQLILPDGSKVWLNAASSIRFPTAFAGKEREVQITGEVYFEVTKDAEKPFKVKEGNLVIEVLGTHFNVNAYSNEPDVKVTLLEGSVRVSQLALNGNGKVQSSQLLQPGEQMQVKQNGKIQLIENANINKVIAWKNNLFWFDDDDIQTVMRQIARWYHADIEIRGTISQHFTGSIPRDIMVSEALEVLRRTESIHFQIEGQKIIVSP
jgi:ferric-dicitrate binding protein FerR (iron transport regulator)